MKIRPKTSGSVLARRGGAILLGAILLLALLFLARTLLAEDEAVATGDGISSDWRLTEAERQGFVEAVGACWTVEPHFRNVTVRVRFALDRDGRVIDNFVDLVDARGGDDAGQNDAYEAVRRAILRCEGRGYDLPVEKYEIWNEAEMTFDGRNGTPEG